jgi:hypothetical protein
MSNRRDRRNRTPLFSVLVPDVWPASPSRSAVPQRLPRYPHWWRTTLLSWAEHAPTWFGWWCHEKHELMLAGVPYDRAERDAFVLTSLKVDAEVSQPSFGVFQPTG